MGNEHAAGFPDALENALLIPGDECSQVDHFHGYRSFLCKLLGNPLGQMSSRSPGDDRQIGALVDHARLAERDEVIAAGLRRTGVHPAIQPFVLQEEDRVFGSRGRLDESLGIGGGGGIDDIPARDMGKEGLDIRRMPGAALDVSADGDPNDHGGVPDSVAAPTDACDLVAQLHEAGPDVISELDLDDRLVAAGGHASRDADDARFGQSRIDDPSRKGFSQAARHAENASLGISDVLAPHHDLRVALHLFPQAPVDGLHHADLMAGLEAGVGFFGNRRVSREDMLEYVVMPGKRMAVGILGRLVHLFLDAAPQ